MNFAPYVLTYALRRASAMARMISTTLPNYVGSPTLSHNFPELSAAFPRLVGFIASRLPDNKFTI